MSKIGILAGSGGFPYQVAKAAAEKGEVFVIAYAGIADKSVRKFPHAEFSFLQINTVIKRLKEEGCSKLVLIGKVDRPVASVDSVGEDFAADIPAQLIAYAQEETGKQKQNSDDALLTALIRYLEEEEGFEIMGAEKVCPLLTSKAGFLAGKSSKQDKEDIVLALRVAEQLGDLSIGQSVVVCRGVVLAVEAAEGTDNMLKRVLELPQVLRGSKDELAGVLVKLPRRHQDMRIDLPAIGLETVKHVKAAALTGLVVEENRFLLDRRDEVIEQAEKGGLFIQVVKR